MASGWLNHKQLMIVKGIGKTPGDTNSAEPDPVVFNLMAEDQVSLTPNGWTPQIAAVKSGGVWADSPISDGRQLLTAPVGNVTEKIEILIADNSYLGVMKQLDTLYQMARDCRDFWQTQTQVHPVYLLWYAGCGAGQQFAQLFNIELAPEYQDATRPTIKVTITLEREPYWRAIPPGANPKIWTYYVNLSHPQYNTSGASLVANSDHLITQTIQNKAEWNPTAYGLQTVFLSQNFIDITASQVPGDAPALIEMSLTSDLRVSSDIYIARYSLPQTSVGHDAISRANSFTLNAGDGSVGTATKRNTGSATTGALSNGSSVNFFDAFRQSTGIDANFADFVTWGESSGTGLIRLDRNFFSGSFAIFCRGRNGSAAAPLTGDMRIRLVIDEFENNATQYLNSITLPETNPSAGVGSYVLTYMGTITIPFENRAVQSLSGYGLQFQESTANFRVRLQQKVDVATANRVFEFSDLIFMPISDGFFQAKLNFNSSNTSSVVLYDNTGYLSRGNADPSVLGYLTNSISGGVNQELRGQDIYLSPHKNQRLYVIFSSFDIAGNIASYLNQTQVVRLNIVPRWSSIRDT